MNIKKQRNFMSKLKEIQLLVAKTGVFFANCDGEYDKKEKEFIAKFILNMIHKGIDIDESLNELIDVKHSNISIEEVVLETKEFLNSIDREEQILTISMMKEFIERLINIDGVKHEKEVEYFNKWKQEISL